MMAVKKTGDANVGSGLRQSIQLLVVVVAGQVIVFTAGRG
jgi:hypothetical protein